MEPPTEQRDPRMDFLSNYTCKALRLKEDKWSRMIVSDEQRSYLNNFMEGCWPQARFFFLYRKCFINLIFWKETYLKFQSMNIEQWYNSFKFGWNLFTWIAEFFLVCQLFFRPFLVESFTTTKTDHHLLRQNKPSWY